MGNDTTTTATTAAPPPPPSQRKLTQGASLESLGSNNSFEELSAQIFGIDGVAEDVVGEAATAEGTEWAGDEVVLPLGTKDKFRINLPSQDQRNGAVSMHVLKQQQLVIAKQLGGSILKTNNRTNRTRTPRLPRQARRNARRPSPCRPRDATRGPRRRTTRRMQPGSRTRSSTGSLWDWRRVRAQTRGSRTAVSAD